MPSPEIDPNANIERLKSRRLVRVRKDAGARRHVGTLEPSGWRVIFWPLNFFWPKPK